MARLKMTAEEFEVLAAEGVPYVGQLGCRVESFEAGRVVVRLPYREFLLRPGGTICGPAMMALADIVLYGAVLSMIGRVELAVTTDLTIHFLRKPGPGDLLAEGRLLKLGTRLAVGDVLIRSEGRDAPVAHATGTYAIPDPRPQGGAA
ncbi:PaaI family thioesterase [Marinimicrococcus flavescens]|uniref:PaaI family thioesterase n=1 Tax=Marinimicrococcus flavescens TaxID=3031815 RepID=A0AAP3UZ05_9PROT|nr:PaaI family thioesterase [Marinimicrococcus flavescens]